MTSLRMKALVGLCSASLALAGCHHKEPVPFPTYSLSVAGAATPSDASGSFGRYVAAAQQVQASSAKYLYRTTFTPGMRASVVQSTGPAVASVAAGASGECHFAFQPHAPFEAQPYRAEWRLIGRALAWRIAQKCEKADFDGAISDAILAMKFGFDLTGGSAVDASLGFSIAGDARRAIALYLPKLGAGQLGRLGEGVAAALARKPPVSQTLQNEHANMLLAVQAVQQAYQNQNWSTLTANLSSDAREAIQYLQEEKGDAAPAYFQGFAQEAEAQTQALIRQSEMPVAKRREDPGPSLQKTRPWRRFAHYFFSGGQTLLDMNDEELARTRLLALECRLLQDAKSQRALPSNLDAMPKALNLDPYTGGSFMYRVDGLNFLVYSVGPDLTDDGGDTDAAYSRPDLTLERPRT